MHLTLTWRTKFFSIVTCATNSLNEELVENIVNRPGCPTHVFPSHATRAPTQWGLAYFILTTLSATFDVTELLLRSQKMLPAYPLPLREACILPRCCCPNASLVKAYPIFHATWYPNPNTKPLISHAHPVLLCQLSQLFGESPLFCDFPLAEHHTGVFLYGILPTKFLSAFLFPVRRALAGEHTVSALLCPVHHCPTPPVCLTDMVLIHNYVQSIHMKNLIDETLARPKHLFG